MSKTIVISDTLYEQLNTLVQQRGLSTIEQLLESMLPFFMTSSTPLLLKDVWTRYHGRVSGRTYNAVHTAIMGQHPHPAFVTMTWHEFLQQARRPKGGQLRLLYGFGDVALDEVRRICHDVPPNV